MKKTNSLKFYLVAFGIFGVIMLGINSYANHREMGGSDKKSKASIESKENENQKLADTVQVFLFHSTNRCYSCITAGEFAKETIEKNFSEELQMGKIEFREINVDLPENKELANKFKASGTSFFINSIIDGQDNIKEDAQIWRLISNKQSFEDYLTAQINKLI